MRYWKIRLNHSHERCFYKSALFTINWAIELWNLCSMLTEFDDTWVSLWRHTATTARTTTPMTSSTNVCGRHHCTSTQRCVVGSRGRARCAPRRRPSRLSFSHRRAPDGQCPPGFMPTRNRRRCRGSVRGLVMKWPMRCAAVRTTNVCCYC